MEKPGQRAKGSRKARTRAGGHAWPGNSVRTGQLQRADLGPGRQFARVGCSALQLPDPSVSASLPGLFWRGGCFFATVRCCGLRTLELGACALQPLLSGRLMVCNGSSLGLQEVRRCCGIFGLVARGLAAVGCGATHHGSGGQRLSCHGVRGHSPRVWCPVGKQFIVCWSLPVACWQGGPMPSLPSLGERRLVAVSYPSFSPGNDSRDVACC